MAKCQPTSGSEDEPRQGGSGSDTRRRLLLAALVAAVVAGLVALVFATGLNRKLSLTELRDRRAELQAFVHRHPVLSLEIYGGAYAAVVALSIPGALVMSLAGGYLFGALLGAPVAVAGETAGAVLMFLAARSTLGHSFLKRFIRQGGIADKLARGVEEHPFTGLLMLRLIPAMPFGVVNIAAGLVRMPVGAYLAATVVGIAPSTFIYAWVGQGLGVALNRNGVPKLSSLLRPEVYLPLGALAVGGVAMFALQLRRKRGAPSPAGGNR